MTTTKHLSAKEILKNQDGIEINIVDDEGEKKLRLADIYYSEPIESGKILPTVAYEIRQGKKPQDRSGRVATIYKVNIISVKDNKFHNEQGFSSESLDGVNKWISKQRDLYIENANKPPKVSKPKSHYRKYTTWK